MSSVLDIPGVRQAALLLNIQQYHSLCETGIIPERTELLAGIVVRKMGKSPLHTWTVEFLADWLRARLAPDQTLRVEQPLTLVDSEPEADLAVVAGSRDDYRSAHPTNAELVVEVAITTEELDKAKAAIYAAAGVSQYWLALPERGQLVVHRECQPALASYAQVTVLGRRDRVAWAGQELPCAELFPDV
ncbi:MAG: Uma2 family endonuclease [Pirellulaceae bacterium]|nr:Uma2 family endonuclease [Pirellulaceae bacterium]